MAGRTVITRLILDPRGYLGGIKTAAAATRDFGSEFDKAATKGGKNFDQLARGSAIAGAAVLAGLGMAAHAAMDFDRAMSGVVANGRDYVQNQKALRQAALDAGAATQFSATQAAKAQTELAKAGVSARDILKGGLTGALSLAAAGELEVADAAEIAATAMTQFKLKGDQIPHVADLLSAGANKASGNVQQLGMALKQGGLVAAQAGWSIEETTGMLTEFAAAGLKGSDGGTSLKTMLLMLMNPTEKSAALMKKLGLSAYDASGGFVSAQNLAGQLRDKLGGLTEEQRNAALATIFGSDAIRGASIAYQNGAAGTKKWQQEVNDAGNAARTAATKTDNLSGDLERLGGAFDTALIKQGSSSTGVLRFLTQAGTDMVDTFSGAPGAIQGTVTVLGLVTGGALAAAGAYGVLAPKVRESSKALSGMGPTGKAANTALIGAAKYGGLALGAITALSIVGTVGDKFAQAAPDVDRLTRALQKYANTRKGSGELSRLFGGDLGKLKSAIEIQRSALANPTAAKVGSFITSPLDHWMDDSNNNLIKKLQATDAALAQMVSSGHADQAAKAIREMGISGKETAGVLPQYTGAIGDAKDKTADAGQSFATTAGQAHKMASGLQTAAHEAGSLQDVLSGLNNVNIDAAEAEVSYQQGLNGLTKALRENHGALNGKSNAALENRHIMLGQITTSNDYLSKQYEQIKATQGEVAAANWASQAHGNMRTAMIHAATAAGIGKQAVTAMVDALFRIPSNTPAHVSTPGAVGAKRQVTDLDGAIKLLKGKLARVDVIGPVSATSEVGRLRDAIARLQGKKVTVETVFRELHFGSSKVQGPYIGADGAAHRWGGIDSYAAGGIAQVAGPGTLVKWAEPETGGEAYVPKNGDPARSRSILDTAASWYGMKVSPMSAGGVQSFAAGGTSVPVSSWMSAYNPSSFSSAADVTAASRARLNAVGALATAERRLDEDRRRRRISAAKLASDEAAIAKARRSLATATEKLVRVQASYQASKTSTVDRFRGAVAKGTQYTGNFLANLQKLADRGFGTLAMQLLDMGGDEAMSIASGAVKLSNSALKGTEYRLNVAQAQAQQLQFFGQISGARAAVKKGNGSFEGIMSATGSTGDDLATALKLIATELGKSSTGRALLADMHDHGYADGGIAPPGTRYRWSEPSSGGEALIPLAGSKRSTATPVLGTVAGRFGYQLVPAGAAGGGGAGPAPVVHADVRVFVGNREITDIARTEVRTAFRSTGRQIANGRA